LSLGLEGSGGEGKEVKKGEGKEGKMIRKRRE
jgi:hypothetical protein